MTALPPNKKIWNQNLIQVHSIGPIHIREDKNLIKSFPEIISEIPSDARQPQNFPVTFRDLAKAASVVHLCLQES